jgi:hypothetical protein
MLKSSFTPICQLLKTLRGACVADSLLDECYDINTIQATSKQETADMFLELHTRIKDLPVSSSQGSAFA